MPNIEILIHRKKTLKLTNVLIKEIDLSRLEYLVNESTILENYIRTKGARGVGPIIQHSDGKKGVSTVQFSFQLMQQIDKHNINTSSMYTFKDQIIVRNCMLAKYSGPINKLSLAYKKIEIEAFENNYSISGEYYIVFIDESKDHVRADIFMPVKWPNE